MVATGTTRHGPVACYRECSRHHRSRLSAVQRQGRRAGYLSHNSMATVTVQTGSPEIRCISSVGWVTKKFLTSGPTSRSSDDDLSERSDDNDCVAASRRRRRCATWPASSYELILRRTANGHRHQEIVKPCLALHANLVPRENGTCPFAPALVSCVPLLGARCAYSIGSAPIGR